MDENILLRKVEQIENKINKISQITNKTGIMLEAFFKEKKVKKTKSQHDLDIYKKIENLIKEMTSQIISSNAFMLGIETNKQFEISEEALFIKCMMNVAAKNPETMKLGCKNNNSYFVVKGNNLKSIIFDMINETRKNDHYFYPSIYQKYIKRELKDGNIADIPINTLRDYMYRK